MLLVHIVSTCTTGACPCNTANVSGVPWRVSGYTEGCLFTVLGTWEVIGKVQGERYTAINMKQLRAKGSWGGRVRRNKQENKWK